jgi:hypothetical protein
MNTPCRYRRSMTHTACSLVFAILLAGGASPSLHAQLSSWEPMNRGLLHRLVYTIEIDPVDSLVMYCGTEYGNLYKSYDGGYNWVMRRNGIPSNYNGEQVTALFLDPVDRKKLFCGFGGRQSEKNLFWSSDSAASWEVVTTPASWKNGGVLNIYRTGGAAPVLFCGLGWGTGIWRSSDGGGNWTKTLGDFGIQVIGGSPAAPAILFAGSSWSDPSPGPLPKSTDLGLNWVRSFTSASGSTGVRAIAVAPQNPSHVYAAITGTGQGLHRSIDGGSTWTKLTSTRDISEIAIHPNNENLIYLSSVYEGVLRTMDGGTTWTSIKDGLPAVPIMRIRIAPGYPVRVFAVTLKEGIYRLVEEELPESFVR